MIQNAPKEMATWAGLQGARADQQHKKSSHTVEMGVSLPLLNSYL